MADTFADLLNEVLGPDEPRFRGAASMAISDAQRRSGTPLRRVPSDPLPARNWRQGDISRERQFRIEGARDQFLRGPALGDRAQAAGTLAWEMPGNVLASAGQMIRADQMGDAQSRLEAGVETAANLPLPALGLFGRRSLGGVVSQRDRAIGSILEAHPNLTDAQLNTMLHGADQSRLAEIATARQRLTGQAPTAPPVASRPRTPAQQSLPEARLPQNALFTPYEQRVAQALQVNPDLTDAQINTMLNGMGPDRPEDRFIGIIRQKLERRLAAAADPATRLPMNPSRIPTRASDGTILPLRERGVSLPQATSADLSEAARMRARESDAGSAGYIDGLRAEGFDVETPYYRGNDGYPVAGAYNEPPEGGGVFLTPSPRVAEIYTKSPFGESATKYWGAGETVPGGYIEPLFIRGRLTTRERFERPVERGGFGGDEVAARAAGFTGYRGQIKAPGLEMTGGLLSPDRFGLLPEVYIFDRTNVAPRFGGAPSNTAAARNFVVAPHPDGGEVLMLGDDGRSLGGQIGRIHYQRTPEGLRVVHSRVWQEHANQGHGAALYEELIRRADAEGLPVIADRNISPDALRVYQSLERRGYRVERDASGKPLSVRQVPATSRPPPQTNAFVGIPTLPPRDAAWLRQAITRPPSGPPKSTQGFGGQLTALSRFAAPEMTSPGPKLGGILEQARRSPNRAQIASEGATGLGLGALLGVPTTAIASDMVGRSAEEQAQIDRMIMLNRMNKQRLRELLSAPGPKPYANPGRVDPNRIVYPDDLMAPNIGYAVHPFTGRPLPAPK